MSARNLAVEFDEQKIDALFADLDQGTGPGAAIGIAIGGRPVYRKGFGLASVELPVILSPSIRMRIGSTTKHFTAFTFMRLCEEGLAGIDDPLHRYLPELHPVTHPVTMRQLMGNTSGLRDANDIAGQFSNLRARRVTADDLLALYRDIDDTDAPPGTTFAYNNGNWVLLSAVVERITGKPLEEVMRERVFEPVGMLDTLVRRWDSEMVPNSASSHARNAAGRYERTEMCGGVDFAGAGAMVSTIDDMLRWMANMDAHEVGSAATWAAMKTPHLLPNGTSTGYGFGLVIDRYRGADIIHHGGGGCGSNVQMLKVSRADLDVMVMINSKDVFAILRAYDILDACLPDLDPVQTSTDSEATAPPASGTFRSPTTGRLIQLFAGRSRMFPGDKRQIGVIDGVEIPFAPDKEGVLWPAGTATFQKKSLTLIGNAEQPASIRYSDFGNIDELLRVQPGGEGEVGSIEGRYRSQGTGTEVRICDTPQGPWMHVAGRFGSSEFRLECLLDDVWQATLMGTALQPRAILSFAADGSSFRYNSISSRNLRFTRAD